ncbi:MAG TPA: lipoyl(octanoyl) transferase LipB [Candidatus Acidoferrum sp.]|jgi:lipoyl(octanoyl) transferase|nr:lipoyl(octanoyl) transferase LipB [Candidatus Acidoferrum sp.]
MATKTLISLVQLGTVDYATGLRLQQQLVALRKEEKISDALLLLEHSPVITLGRNAKAANVIASPELLAQRGVELFECDRGGDVTFHGPGQIVGYPIFDLRGHARGAADASSAFRKTLGAVDFIRRLEEVLIRTCADFAIPTKRVPGLTGVWTDLKGRDFSRADSGHDKEPASAAEVRPEAKLAAIGVHISRFVTSHGFALNVNTDLSFFNLIIPCGITAKPVTSMQQELGKPLDLSTVAESISRNFGTVFSSQMLWVETLDALLGRTVGVPVQPPAELRQLHKEDRTNWA